MSSDPVTSEAGASPLEGQLSLQINECLGAISFEKAFRRNCSISILLTRPRPSPRRPTSNNGNTASKRLQNSLHFYVNVRDLDVNFEIRHAVPFRSLLRIFVPFCHVVHFFFAELVFLTINCCSHSRQLAIYFFYPMKSERG
jgi:hypothetical protein